MKIALSKIFGSQQSGIILVILLIGTVLTVFSGSHPDRVTGGMVNNFLNQYTLMQTATDASFFAIMAIGATIVVISGGIDLSVGSIYAFAGVITAMALRAMGPTDSIPSLLTAATLCIGIGLACGLTCVRACERAHDSGVEGASVHHHIRHNVDFQGHRICLKQGGKHSCPRLPH
ncbi:MAG: hypothetical protein NT118_10050 [Lentisphaerae bacterium]|nr:hypothetical protein [Lentisphaerota bacterium]